MTSPFYRALEWLWPIEGGWWAGTAKSDPNPTMYGITARTFADAQRRYNWYPKPVREITKAEATVIYWLEYWMAGGCHKLAWPLALVHFDACVNHGVGNAARLLRRANGSWVDYIAARISFYKAIIEANPDLAPNARGWANRMTKLESACAKA